MKNPISQIKEESNEVNLPQEIMHLLKILEQIETHTAELRAKLMEELKKDSTSRIVLNLDSIKE